MRRGPSPGASDQHVGRFELADGGTLLLDEISEISADLQAKLLRVLEEREFERVGGSRPIHVDVRIVATTNRDLLAEVKRGRFREDLYYRLNVITIRLQPLRERRSDIPLLIRHYLGLFAREMGTAATLSDEAMGLLVEYRWPGNVRELVNIVERLLVLNGGAVLDRDAVSRCLPELGAAGKSPAQPRAPAALASGAVAFGDAMSLEELERRHIIATLERVGGNKQEAADRLGIARRTLWDRLERYRLDPGVSVHEPPP